jgi:hypothetical protein
VSKSRCIVVAGMVAGDPFQGGATWAVLQYVLGLQQLGHDVAVIDPLPPGAVSDTVRTYFASCCAAFGLEGRSALLPLGGDPIGLEWGDIVTLLHKTDVLINLSGRLRDHDLVATVPVRVFVDLDPAFIQLWHAQGIELGLDQHTHHVTVGAAVARPASQLPRGGYDWRPIVPPVVLSEWPACASQPPPRLTTVANWRSYGSITHNGRHFGQKAHAFRSLECLPLFSPVPIDVALSIDPGDEHDRTRLTAAGWQLVDPLAATGDPDRYRRFVQSSWAELGVAKSGYVTGRTGWFSDRSACYLASGRPVIASDTGLGGDSLPLGTGLLTFTSTEEAVECITRVATEYPRHAEAARRIAVEHLDAAQVLDELLAAVLA